MKPQQMIQNLLRCWLVGLGQIMLQNNPYTGLLFLVGIAIGSMPVAIGAIVGVISGTTAAFIFKCNRQEITNGLYGFNGSLVGMAMFFFLQPQPVTLLLAVGGSAMSSLVMKGFLRSNVPAFTAPFILVTWVLLYFAQTLAVANHASSMSQSWGILEGLGQVMFQDNTLSGLFILLGLSINSRKEALWAFSASAAAMLIALAVGYSQEKISAGLFGYNAALCAIALANKNPIYPIAATVGTVFLTSACGQIGITALTAPFVIATWIALVIKSKLPTTKVTS
jgi:urea transporter